MKTTKMKDDIFNFKQNKITETQLKSERSIFPIIEKARCTGCSRCVAACPKRAIQIMDRIAVIDIKKCRNCKRCIKLCPQNAIL